MRDPFDLLLPEPLSIRSYFYTLDDNGTPVPESDVIKWGMWLETAERIVCQDTTACGVDISTVFLGLDHNHFGEGAQKRYATRDEALAGHVEMAARAIQLEAR